MKVNLIKISANPNALRTTSVAGETNALPEVGKCFRMTAEALDPHMDFRLVETSQVTSVEKLSSLSLDDRYEFTTQNSIYELTVNADL